MNVVGVMCGTVTVQMSIQELSELTGLSADGRNGMYVNSRYVPWDHLSGHEFTIREGWERLHALNQNRPELQKAIKQLRAIADVLEPIELVVYPEPDEPSAPPSAIVPSGELLTEIELIAAKLGTAEWASPEDAEAMLQELIDRHHASLSSGVKKVRGEAVPNG